MRSLGADVTSLRRRLQMQTEALARQTDEKEALTHAAEQVEITFRSEGGVSRGGGAHESSVRRCALYFHPTVCGRVYQACIDY